MNGILLQTNDIIKKKRITAYAGKPIAEIIDNGFFTVDNQWTVQYWNKAAERILKVPSAAIVGKNLWEAFVAFIPLEFYAVYHKAFEKNIPLHFQEYWGEMGSWFDVITYYCDNTLSVSFKSSNRSEAFEHPATVEQQLQIKTGLYEFITEVTNDCLWEWDLLSKEIFWIDGGHKRVLGYHVENALIPQSFWESLIHPEDRKRVMGALDHLLIENAGTKWELEYRCKKADGEFAWVHDRGHIIYEDGQAVRMIGATRDISDKVLLEQTLAAERLTREKDITRSVLSAQQKERTAIGNELVDDINQVLAAGKLYIELAKKDTINREALLQKSCNHIVQAMASLSRISKGLVPPFIEVLGLVKSIKVLTNDTAALNPVQFTTADTGLSLEGLDEKLLLDLYRIVQHQVNNIVQHAGASVAKIDITRYHNEIVLFIADNGHGYNLTEIKQGHGLDHVSSLAFLYNGSVIVSTGPGEGYSLQVIFRL